ncbi:hypothetical protein ACFX13_045047 [Malus domestica]
MAKLPLKVFLLLSNFYPVAFGSLLFQPFVLSSSRHSSPRLVSEWIVLRDFPHFLFDWKLVWTDLIRRFQFQEMVPLKVWEFQFRFPKFSVLKLSSPPHCPTSLPTALSGFFAHFSCPPYRNYKVCSTLYFFDTFHSNSYISSARVDYRRKGGGWKQTRFCSRDLFDDKPILLQSSSMTKSIRRLAVTHLSLPHRHTPYQNSNQWERGVGWQGWEGRGRSEAAKKGVRVDFFSSYQLLVLVIERALVRGELSSPLFLNRNGVDGTMLCCTFR